MERGRAYSKTSILGVQRRWPIRSTLSQEEFFRRLSQTIDDDGTLWRLIPSENRDDSPVGESKKKYVGTVEKNDFYIRRPWFDGAKTGTTLSGRVQPSGDGTLIAVCCEPNPLTSLFVRSSKWILCLVVVMTFFMRLLYPTLTPGGYWNVAIAGLILALPLCFWSLFLHFYYRWCLVPDRELYEHVLSIAVDSEPIEENHND